MLGLQRAKTAREAIKVMTKLVEDYGYGDTGESISVADPKEAWILEIVGTGPGGKGAAWVAVRIPDGYISCHTNISRIGEIPRNDPVNWMYSDNVESFAVSKGWYDPEIGQAVQVQRGLLPADALPASAPARRGSGAFTAGRPRRRTSRPTTTARSPARSRIRCGSSRTTSFRRPTCLP